MSGLITLLAAVGGLVLGLLVARRQSERRAVASHEPVVVALPTMTDVIEEAPRLWRGPAPDAAGYHELVSAGCTLIVDLRAEDDGGQAEQWASEAGVDRILLPTWNSRTPAADHVDQFAAAHEYSTGSTYVHCEAGEGRTGAILGAYAVRHGQPRSKAVSHALSVGSLTFAQLVYIASGARLPALVNIVDWLVDRPTEAAFDVMRRLQSG